MKTPKSDSDIDRLLEAAGASWRLTQPPPPEPAWSDRRPLPSVLLGRVGALAVVVGVLALMVVVVLNSSFLGQLPVAGTPPPGALGSSTPSPGTATDTTPHPTASDTPAPTPPSEPSPTPTPIPLSAQVVAEGDQVMAVGVIRQMGADSLFVCRRGTGGFWPESPCWGVPVTGVDIANLPAWADDRSSPVVVTGTWESGAIAVSDVSRFTPTPPGPVDPPCSPPEGGWNPPASDIESAARRLGEEVAAHPDLYGGLWSTVVESGTTEVAVIVVGTVGSVDSTRRRLEEIYPHSLCVTGVDFSEAELRAVEDRLNPPRGPGVATFFEWLNRVHFIVPLLDEATVALIGPDADRVLVDPLVRRLVP